MRLLGDASERLFLATAFLGGVLLGATSLLDGSAARLATEDLATGSTIAAVVGIAGGATSDAGSRGPIGDLVPGWLFWLFSYAVTAGIWVWTAWSQSLLLAFGTCVYVLGFAGGRWMRWLLLDPTG